MEQGGRARGFRSKARASGSPLSSCWTHPMGTSTGAFTRGGKAGRAVPLPPAELSGPQGGFPRAPEDPRPFPHHQLTPCCCRNTSLFREIQSGPRGSVPGFQLPPLHRRWTRVWDRPGHVEPMRHTPLRLWTRGRTWRDFRAPAGARVETSVPGEPPCAPQRVSDPVSKGPASPEAGGGTVGSKKDRLTLAAVLRCPPSPLRSLWSTSGPSRVPWGPGFLGRPEHTRHPRRSGRSQ